MCENNNENRTRTSEEYLEKIITGNDRIFIDTCSMLQDAFPAFMEHVIPVLKKTGKRIIVPTVVIDEIRKHLDNPSKPELSKPAQIAFSYLCRYKTDYFWILGEAGDPFPDNLFQTIYVKFREKYKMLFITQDKGLAADMLNVGSSNSVHCFPAIVKRITDAGYLMNLNVERVNGKWQPVNRNPVAVRDVFTQHSESAFRICSQPSTETDQLISITEMPASGDSVYARNPKTGEIAELPLKDLIASGGEGCIYETDTRYVAKIYKEDKITTLRRKKVLLMCSKKLNYGGISFPVLPLYNSRSEFVGYLMKRAKGTELRRSAFCPFINKEHPDWKREDLVQLCITILKKIEYLHSKNIIIGDINPNNILVTSPKEVFIVDTDSFQIEDLPCPVGQINYTAPEILGRPYADFLRTMGNENFAIATLLFQILLPGKLPYAHAGGGTQNENILEMNFPYRLGENANHNEPGGQWKYMWSHLTYKIKEDFYYTFQKGGKYSTEETRLSASDWIRELKTYHYLLTSHKLAETDAMSEEIFPTRFKAGKDAKWTTCRACGEPVPYYGNGRKPEYCEACNHRIVRILTCEECGEDFPLSAAAENYLQMKGYDMPKRCPTCRAKRKAADALKHQPVSVKEQRKKPGEEPRKEPREKQESLGTSIFKDFEWLFDWLF